MKHDLVFFCNKREPAVQTTLYTVVCFDHDFLNRHLTVMDAFKVKAAYKLYRNVLDIIVIVPNSKNPAYIIGIRIKTFTWDFALT